MNNAGMDGYSLMSHDDELLAVDQPADWIVTFKDGSEARWENLSESWISYWFERTATAVHLRRVA